MEPVAVFVVFAVLGELVGCWEDPRSMNAHSSTQTCLKKPTGVAGMNLLGFSVSTLKAMCVIKFIGRYCRQASAGLEQF